MKNKTIALTTAIFSVILFACGSHAEDPSAKNSNQKTVSSRLSVDDSFSRFIPIDTANKMLSSYLTSINYTASDTNLQSLIVDVNQLRKYIDSMPNSNEITHIKLMFAHTLPFANSPRANSYVGYNTRDLTLIIAAYDASGNYVYYTNNMVLDYTQPCPPVCPPGNASSALLPNVPNSNLR